LNGFETVKNVVEVEFGVEGSEEFEMKRMVFREIGES
jgi:hypothetical protein